MSGIRATRHAIVYFCGGFLTAHVVELFGIRWATEHTEHTEAQR